MTTNIYDIANELERSIRQLPEYQAVAAAKAAIQENPEAKRLLEEYTVYQTEFQEHLQTGQLPDEAMQQKLQEFGQKIQSNSLLTDYFGKHQQLSVYIADVEKIIFKPLQELMQ